MSLIPVWVRALVLAVFVGIVFSSGWQWRGAIAKADLAKVEEGFAQERQQARDAAERALESAAAASDQAAKKHATDDLQTVKTITVIKKDINHEQIAAAVSGRSCNLPVRWVRLYDDALRAGSYSAATIGNAIDSSAGAGLSEGLASGYSEWDAASVHAENAARWASCRSQLNALIDFHTRADSQSGDGISTPGRDANMSATQPSL